MKRAICLVLLSVLMMGASGRGCRKGGPSGGNAGSNIREGGFVMSNSVAQPENPSHQATQATALERDTTLIIPAGTEIIERQMDQSNHVISSFSYRLPVATTQSVRLRMKNDTAIGAAHRSFAADIAARAKSLRPVQYAGIGLILAAIALLYFKWPTPAIVAGVSGIGLIVLSNVLISHSALIAIVLGVGVVVLLIFYAYDRGALDDYLPDRLDRKPKPKKPAPGADTVAELLEQTEIVSTPAKKSSTKPPPAADTVSELLETTEIKNP